jgi:hypothetical protein
VCRLNIWSLLRLREPSAWPSHVVCVMVYHHHHQIWFMVYVTHTGYACVLNIQVCYVDKFSSIESKGPPHASIHTSKVSIGKSQLQTNVEPEYPVATVSADKRRRSQSWLCSGISSSLITANSPPVSCQTLLRKFVNSVASWVDDGQCTNSKPSLAGSQASRHTAHNLKQKPPPCSVSNATS